VTARELAQQGLEHEALAELDVLDFVDGAHATDADQTDHAVTRTGDYFAALEFSVVAHTRG
jgi:hypothetical protein